MKMLPYSNFTAEEIDGYIRSVKPEQVKRSLSQAEHKFTDFLHFISPAAADLLPGVAAEPVPGVTLAMCLEGEFHE